MKQHANLRRVGAMCFLPKTYLIIYFSVTDTESNISGMVGERIPC